MIIIIITNVFIIVFITVIIIVTLITMIINFIIVIILSVVVRHSALTRNQAPTSTNTNLLHTPIVIILSHSLLYIRKAILKLNGSLENALSVRSSKRNIG